MMWLPHFLQWCPNRLPLFNLVQNSVVHSPSAVIRDPKYGSYPPAPVAHSEWVCGTICRRSPLHWSCRRWWVGCIYGWLGLDDPSAPVVLPSKWPTGYMSSAQRTFLTIRPAICSPPWNPSTVSLVTIFMSSWSPQSTCRVVAGAGVPCSSVFWDSWFGLLSFSLSSIRHGLSIS